MVLSNEAGILPVPFEEVEIARTVYRDGGSEYLLNRSACRLRDIQDLYRDTGMGAGAYSVIENRMIDAILSDRAEERRSLFEEASGIGKYKDRRKAASRRLERAELDLQRLEDVIAEVESKVRSLARQKGKAERYHELRARRLDVEVAVVRGQLAELEARRTELAKVVEGGAQEGAALDAEIRAAEARVETLQVERVEAERLRGEVAAEVEKLRTELTRWEREMAVAEERSTYASRRLEQLVRERDEARAQGAAAETERVEIATEETRLGGTLEALRKDESESRSRSEAVRARLLEARGALDALETREREIALRVAQLQGDAESAESQLRDLATRLEHLQIESDASGASLAELDSQGDLFNDRLATLEEGVATAQAEVTGAETTLAEARAAFEEARRAELSAEDRAASLETRLTTLERVERDREGVDPVVKALLEDGFPGVLGILADFVEAGAAEAQAVESYLGILSRGVVVRDMGTARALLAWFRSSWKQGGGLIVFPLDRIPEHSGKGPLLDRVKVTGEGAPWVRALLSGVGVEGEEPASDRTENGVGADGAWSLSGGVMRVGNPLGASGLLERKTRLESLRKEGAGARKEADGAREARERSREVVVRAEEGVEVARGVLREAEDRRREARSEVTAREDQRSRLARAQDELDRQMTAAREARTRAEARGIAAREEREALLSEEEGFRTGRAEARQEVDAAQEEWERARAEESRLTVERTRLEGEVARFRERISELEGRRDGAVRRVEALDREEGELQAELTRAGELLERGRGELETLFARRTEAQERLRERDEALTTLREALAEAERGARAARSTEREASERRHRLELEFHEVTGRIERIRERLEVEWSRPLERLLEEASPVEGTEEELRMELRQIIEGLDRIGPVNMLAVEEHEEENARLGFLTSQRDDLVEARDDLRAAIREINQTATKLFEGTFEAIRENFRKTFLHLFEGGEADLWLADPDDPLESAIEIHASPRGKRTQRIDLLSGGERALTALSLLFGIYLVKPSPFCVLDEVDAPLDESNIGRFIRLLQDFKGDTQFVVITHNPRTIEAADWIYGVTMEEPGVSSIVGVRLEEALEAAAG